jgi:hypothetical protein
VHRIASLVKRWLLSTHQEATDQAHLAAYLDEFVFRFNRRNSRSRGLLFYRVLELAVGHDPVRYSDITPGRKPRAALPTPARTRGTHRAWTVPHWTDLGGALTCTTPVNPDHSRVGMS